MKHFFTYALLFVLFCCSPKTHYYSYTDIKNPDRKDMLVMVYSSKTDTISKLTTPCGYKNMKGQIVIPIGKYQQCFTDTFRTYAIVMDKILTDSKIVAIDRDEHIIFDVYFFDNLPDSPTDGLFRIKRNGKIGYANAKGQIIVSPKFACADAFQDGKARVSYKCNLIKSQNEESFRVASDDWFYIDTKGHIVP